MLDDLVKSVLQEIGEFGLDPATINHYRRTYKRLKEYATAQDVGLSCDTLIRSFLHDIEEQHKAGAIGSSRPGHLRRASLILQEYVTNGSIRWATYTFDRQPMPESRDLLLLHANYLDDLGATNRSANTIQSCANSVRQFLLFLEDHGCTSLALSSAAIVPAFFQHLLATYRPTSIRTVASNIRSFLRFCKDDRLLSAVPSRCVRNKPIIPILSDQETDALEQLLQGGLLSFRDKAIILLALRTGLRSVDILSIQLPHIDWINDTITITQSKTGRAFKIPLTAAVGNALSTYLLDERPSVDTTYVFLRCHAPFTVLSDHSACYGVLRRASHKAGIRVGSERKGLHLLRHSAASRMLSKGVPVTAISAMLGHAHKTSTDVYLATDQMRMRECALDLAKIPVNCAGLS